MATATGTEGSWNGLSSISEGDGPRDDGRVVVGVIGAYRDYFAYDSNGDSSGGGERENKGVGRSLDVWERGTRRSEMGAERDGQSEFEFSYKIGVTPPPAPM